jgi:hypothetical protein
MAKIIVSKGDAELREIVLCKSRITIGRRPQNELVLDDPSVSGEHAAIVMHESDLFLEDLNSTNGTQVNGQPVRKHFLQDGDVIQLAQFRIKYRAYDSQSLVMPSVVGNGDDARRSVSITATVRILNGPGAGKEIVLDKALTTLGNADAQVVAIAHSNKGCFLVHVEGQAPLLNNQAIESMSQPIFPGDIIDLSGTRLCISFS